MKTQKCFAVGGLVVWSLVTTCCTKTEYQRFKISANSASTSTPTSRPSAATFPASDNERASREFGLYSTILTKLFYAEDLLNASGLGDTLVIRGRTVNPEGLEELEKTDFPESLLSAFRTMDVAQKKLQRDYDVEFGLKTVDTDEPLRSLLARRANPGKKAVAALEVSDLVFTGDEKNAGLYLRWIDRNLKVCRMYLAMTLSYRNIGNGMTVTDISSMKWTRLGG